MLLTLLTQKAWLFQRRYSVSLGINVLFNKFRYTDYFMYYSISLGIHVLFNKCTIQ